MIEASELELHRRRLWALCFRMTGVAADADELVQETFMRALSAPPRDRSRELLPWLVRVATNASRDLLRRRKTQAYVGPWLPSPIDLETFAGDERLAPDVRYGSIESLSYAFLLALEALSPTQRAVLVLRDVLGCSVSEVADVLGASEANVKTSHHRARRALERYEEARAASRRVSFDQARAAVVNLLAQIASGDVERIAATLTNDALLLNDGGGEFLAALRPVVSATRIARFIVGTQRDAVVRSMVPATLCGLPALLLDAQRSRPRAPSRSATLFEVDERGAVARMYTVVATRKLAHLFSR